MRACVHPCQKLIPNSLTTLTPIHRRFVLPSVRKGVMPQILEGLLAARKQVKTLMADATRAGDTFLAAVLNERQKALKISANAAYGFTGSSASKLLMVELAEATINYGSTLLQQSAAWVEERFGDQCKVIYGENSNTATRGEVKRWDCLLTFCVFVSLFSALCLQATRTV